MNRDNIIEALDRMTGELARLKAALEAGDPRAHDIHGYFAGAKIQGTG